MFGRLPWLAADRRSLALRFFVFLDMTDQPTECALGSTRWDGSEMHELDGPDG
jgi:hypothetical protein